jgi:hypothetical protein
VDPGATDLDVVIRDRRSPPQSSKLVSITSYPPKLHPPMFSRELEGTGH